MSAELEELTRVAGELPPELVRRVLEYARQLKLSPPGVDYDTDDPTEEELLRERNRAMQRFEDEHPGEDWSQQPYTPGYK
jgi:hypothetical protein